jgi:uncharacterized protein
MPNPIVTDLHVYPVKSCRGTRVDEAEMATTGLDGDRMFQVVDPDGNPITQRQRPAMATIRPTLISGGLRLEADGASPIEIERPTTNDANANSLIGVAVEVADAGEAAAGWLTDLLGQPCRLVALTDDSDCYLPFGELRTPLSWADAAPVLIANTASLDWLVARSTETFTMDRFRPNITVDAGAAWVEDTWSEFTVGDASALLPLPWPRCAVPQVDQTTGERHKEPARVLKQHRWCETAEIEDPTIKAMLEGNGLFGLACALGPAGTTIRVGEEIAVSATAAPILAAPE